MKHSFYGITLNWNEIWALDPNSPFFRFSWVVGWVFNLFFFFPVANDLSEWKSKPDILHMKQKKWILNRWAIVRWKKYWNKIRDIILQTGVFGFGCLDCTEQKAKISLHRYDLVIHLLRRNAAFSRNFVIATKMRKIMKNFRWKKECHVQFW